MNPSIKEFDHKHVWHPYDHASNPADTHLVKHAKGVHLYLDDGTQLIDAMSSWWSVIHGYNHAQINAALKQQIDSFSHVMFGGLTHEPAIMLAEKLLRLTSASSNSSIHSKKPTYSKVFFSDSGSVSVEVAMKMAQQYHYAMGTEKKTKFVTIRSGYHGDTWRAMSVCDPDTGMHHLFKGSLPIEYFVNQPPIAFDQPWDDDETLNGVAQLRQLFDQAHDEIAALILEPIVQGAGGMYFYHPEYLNQCRALCDEYNALFIFDEIATGFGRTGKLFASNHCAVEADIVCLGKALTGGYMSLAATLTTQKISDGIGSKSPGVLMHGPTFMANALACSAANVSLDLLEKNQWQQQISMIETQLKQELQPATDFPNVAKVRVLGGIGVIEMKQVVNPNQAHPLCKGLGVWLRPFGKCIYTMPPYIISSSELSQVSAAMLELARVL